MLGRDRERKRKGDLRHSLTQVEQLQLLLFLFVPRKHHYYVSKLLAVNYLAKLSTQKDILANNTVVA